MSPLPRRPKRVLMMRTTRRGQTGLAPPRSSESRITSFRPPGSNSLPLFSEKESELDTLRADNEDLKNQLAASEEERLELLQQASYHIYLTNTLTDMKRHLGSDPGLPRSKYCACCRSRCSQATEDKQHLSSDNVPPRGDNPPNSPIHLPSSSI